jgi:nucleoside-diphosphate-sugar epimerase
VTGGSGFVGLNVVEALVARGDSVIAAADATLPAYSRCVLERLPGTLVDAVIDVADAASLDSLIAEHRPEAIVHAAVITAGESRELTDLDRVVDVNVKGTAHVLAAALAQGVKRTIYVSSGSAYGAALFEAEAVTEETAPQPDSLYSITKHAAEGLCARYRARHGLEVVCARLGSVFGPWERDTGVRDTLSLPFQIFRRAAAGDAVVLPSREVRRDWVYARDAASGILALLDVPGTRHALYNLSSGVRWSGFALHWCEALQRIVPRFTYRLAGGEETPNVSFLGGRARALMSIERLVADTAYRPRYTDGRVFTEYAAWLATHRAYYDDWRQRSESGE